MTERDPGEVRFERAQRRETALRVLRLAIGLPMAFLSFPALGFPGLALAVMGAIIIAPDVSSLIVWLFTEHRSPNRQPVYSIPESLVKRGKYDEAEAAYDMIIDEFPDELKPHFDLITMAVLEFDDVDLARKYYERGLSKLRTQRAKDELTRFYPVLLSRRERHDIAKQK